MSVTPVIVVALANDASDHLPMLTRERKAISEALQGYEDNRYIRVHVEPNAGIDDLFGLFNRFADGLTVLHYAGHASGTALNLEAPGGGNETAHAGGLARLMGAAPTLKLVFLNGCATQGQVKSLIDAGVKAVIATAVPVNDTMATEFAEQFYRALAAKKSIKAAFDAAVALIASRYGDKRSIGEFRSFRFGSQPEMVDAALTWGLYVAPGADAVTDWSLPEHADNQVIIQSVAAPAAVTTGVVNDGLIQRLFAAIAPHSLEVGMVFEIHKRTGQMDVRTIRQQIIDAFPAPVGEQLRKLFASNTADAARLRQIAVTYESVTKLFAFAMLSQLWNALHEKPDLAITGEQRALIEGFKGLDAANEAVFDYLGLVVAINAVLTDGGVAAFLSEARDLQVELTDMETAKARTFMDGLRERLAAGGLRRARLLYCAIRPRRN
ncbi:MAG: CHAT domain-containing protein [Sphingopyxis sp.]|nr:CHAT domain-containing protein [Sphingopyxis sp.]